MSSESYLTLAVQLFNRQINPDELTVPLAALPKLDETRLTELALEAEKWSATIPRLSYDILKIACMAGDLQKVEIRLQSLCNWQLAKTANAWAQPLLALSAIRQARTGFTQIGDAAWLAACDWQTYSMGWVKGNLIHSSLKLKQALKTLENSNLREFVPECRLALATIQVYLQQFNEAEKNINISERAFTAQGNSIAQARCWLTTANRLRRQNQFKQSMALLQDTLTFFRANRQDQHTAHTLYEMGMLSLYSTTDQATTIRYFLEAYDLFGKCEMELSQGMCQTFLGATYIQDGQLELAEKVFSQSEKIFHHHRTPALLADHYTTVGLLNLAKGEPQKSIEKFKLGQRLHQKIGQSLYAAVDSANLGKAYCLAGRYQDGLVALERARKAISSFQNNTLMVADCEEYMASAWFSLGNISQAFGHLQNAADLYEANQQEGTLITVSNLRARIYFETGNLENTLSSLQDSLQRSHQLGLKPQTALSHRLIGEISIHAGQLDEAFTHLQKALTLFSQMGMSMEVAACEIALGDYYFAAGNVEETRRRYGAALRISQGSFFEIDWRAWAGQAMLAEKKEDFPSALKLYKAAIRQQKKIRSNFWQPGLASSYAKQPSELFDSSTRLAAKMNSFEDMLEFIEADKANSLLNQLVLTQKKTHGETFEGLNELRAEISWLQDQMKVSSDPNSPLKSALQTRQLRQRLAEKSHQFDETNARMERLSQKRHLRPAGNFDLSSLRSLLNHKLGVNWAVIDYYATQEVIHLAVCTSETCTLYELPLTARQMLALEACQKSQQNGRVPEMNDLQILGNFLLPTDLLSCLEPQKYLIISPHGPLHHIPWNALPCGENAASLAECCIPVIVPSLTSLSRLWNETEGASPLHRHGLIVGLSDFNGLHPTLPYVDKELATFIVQNDPESKVLKNAEATWQNLAALSQGNSGKGLANYAYLHLASHFFSDSSSGRLSGFALWKENIYLDQLRELAPLPRLVTFSGCSSIFSLTQAGDEQVGLPITCLLAGAKAVIGCSWPVIDQASAHFMINFYNFYNQGFSAAQTLVQTQRKFISNGERVDSWAGYLCIGLA